MRWIERWRAGRISSVAPTEEAAKRFEQHLDREIPSTIYVTGCDTYQLDQNGRPFLWPATPHEFREMLREDPDGDFEVVPGPAGPVRQEHATPA